ncbi:hypothetical protein FRC11_013291, partial [Ceratobasidium sp. 423]
IPAFLEIPDGNLSKEDIDQLVSSFKAGPGRGANETFCSKCIAEGNFRVWDTKPASLKERIQQTCIGDYEHSLRIVFFSDTYIFISTSI